MKSGTDEMSKSQIEKRKRNIESTYRVSRREKKNVEICFLVQEVNEDFCNNKNIEKSAIISLVWRREGEIINIFSSFEMKKRNFAGE